MKYRVIREQCGFVPQVRRWCWLWLRWYDIRRHVASGVSPRHYPNASSAQQTIIQYKAEKAKEKTPDIVFMTSD